MLKTVLVFFCLIGVQLSAQSRIIKLPIRKSNVKIEGNLTKVEGAVGKIYLSGEHNQVSILIDGGLKRELEDMRKITKQLGERLAAVESKVNPPAFDLKFPRRSTADYVIYRGVPSMRAVTVCFWMKTADKTNEGVPVSYAVPGSDNELLIPDYRRLYIYLGKNNVRTNVAANDGRWHHICVTWENTAGSWVMYKDGQASASGRGLSTGHVITGGGTLILGQDQDSVGGGFQAHQSFIGELSGVNLWSRALVPREISKMSVACTSGDGDVFKWRDVIAGIRGRVQVVRPSLCK